MLPIVTTNLGIDECEVNKNKIRKWTCKLLHIPPTPSPPFSVFLITVFPFLSSKYITLRPAFCFLPPYSLSFFLLSLIPSYQGADKSLAPPTSRCIFFGGKNISFDASLVLYIYY